MIVTKKNLLALICFAILFASCVPSRQYTDAVTARDACIAEKQNLEAQLKTKNEEIARLNESVEMQNDTIIRYSKNVSDLQGRYDDMIEANEQLREIEDKLNNRINQLLALSSSQTQSLNEELTKKEKELDEKEKELGVQQKSLEAAQKDIAEKQKRVDELEAALAAINKKLSDVSTSLEKALTGFNSSDLTVEQKDGKIYVKMSEKLLFASGSAIVDTKGKEALKQIADALRAQQGIQIMVEGHTDNVPLKSVNYPKDNWDLSVLRATAIVKLLTQDYSLSPITVEAAGRGEFMPVGSNADAAGRALNRRTEIIIVPNQEDILKILDGLSK